MCTKLSIIPDYILIIKLQRARNSLYGTAGYLSTAPFRHIDSRKHVLIKRCSINRNAWAL